MFLATIHVLFVEGKSLIIKIVEEEKDIIALINVITQKRGEKIKPVHV